jgi:NitT/TauT family transport system ATP-binding protein
MGPENLPVALDDPIPVTEVGETSRGENGVQFDRVEMVFAGTKQHPPTVAIDEFTLQVDPSEFLVIVGPSGCGKSTILSMAGGLIAPTSGKVCLDREVIRGPGPDKAIVFQNFSLFPWKTVIENIEFGLVLNGMPVAERRRRINYYLPIIGLRGFENHFPRQLSGGMQQRVAIARSLVLRPRLLLMDEPFAALDAQNRTVMQEELVRLWSDYRPTVIFVTHSVEEAVFLADRVVVMTRRPGRIKEVIDVRKSTGAKHWRDAPLDQVMRRSDFQDLRARVWDLIRDEIVIE